MNIVATGGNQIMVSFKTNSIPILQDQAVTRALPAETAESILLSWECHVDHEGFDLNEIEQYYYKHNNISLHHDGTWYKDGGQDKGTNGVLYNWLSSIEQSSNLIIDHSHFVFRYPFAGEAAAQIKEYSAQRPELLRLLSSTFKCGLDLCIDYLGEERVEPVVHIEWDYYNLQDLEDGKRYVEYMLTDIQWESALQQILRYNKLAKENRIQAFDQADFRSMLFFGKKSYQLIPTL